MKNQDKKITNKLIEQRRNNNRGDINNSMKKIINKFKKTKKNYLILSIKHTVSFRI